MYIIYAALVLVLLIAILIRLQFVRHPGDPAHILRGRAIWWLSLIAILVIEGEARLDLLDLEGYSWLLYVHILCALPTFVFLCLIVHTGKKMVRLRFADVNSMMFRAYDREHIRHKRFITYFVIGGTLTLLTAAFYLYLAM